MYKIHFIWLSLLALFRQLRPRASFGIIHAGHPGYPTAVQEQTFNGQAGG